MKVALMSNTRRNISIIEQDTFPIEFISQLAEKESWRKEIYRPIYHSHKWWAKRLGSVFRGVVLGCISDDIDNFQSNFYKQQELSDITVFDPFMGSGTTIGEAHKLGCIALGKDINPIAAENVRISLSKLDYKMLEKTFEYLESSVGKRIMELYKTTDVEGNTCEVLYWFWVKQVNCPDCNDDVDLFTSRIVAKNAYPERKPEIQVCCPNCGNIFTAHYKDKKTNCTVCNCEFNPHEGTSGNSKATCQSCHKEFKIKDSLDKLSQPPKHRLYAKLMLTPNGEKKYEQVNAADIKAYIECEKLLISEEQKGNILLPKLELSSGYNTNQAINYNYKHWRTFFNSRQLLALGWLFQAITGLENEDARDFFVNLFSSILEFNNVFASYKGEGTGAVRHMFSHHILKPEKIPIEANVWGTEKSSGSFLTAFKKKVPRIAAYQNDPFEIQLNGDKKSLCSVPFSEKVNDSHWTSAMKFKSGGIYINCGSSENTSLQSESIDFVITDPPFFDNVHYSELADFFYSWQSLYPHGFISSDVTTRHKSEVQDGNVDLFSSKLTNVFTECNRVLKNNGLMVFTYHHSKAEGWYAVADAVNLAGFTIVNAHPVKAEMSVATPKSQSKEPIQLDIILVCRKQSSTSKIVYPIDEIIKSARNKAIRLRKVGFKLSLGDCRVIINGEFLAKGLPQYTNNIHEIYSINQQDLEMQALNLYESNELLS